MPNPAHSASAASDIRATVALAFELQPGATEVHILPPGPFRAVDGRPTDAPAWMLDSAIAARLIAIQAAKRNDSLIDFEHQSLRSASNGQRVEAAGWFRRLEWRDGSGLWVVGVTWVGDTEALIADRKVRYASAVFAYRPGTGEVLEIISVALTNTPALDGLAALADLVVNPLHHQKEDPMSAEQIAALNIKVGGLETAVAALTAERDAAKASVTALTAERDALKASVATLTTERDAHKAQADALTAEKSQAALAAEKAKHADLVDAALKDGHLPPAKKAWAEKQTLASLTEFLADAARLPLAGESQGGKGGSADHHGLTPEELAMCSKMGVSAEDYAKTKKGC